MPQSGQHALPCSPNLLPHAAPPTTLLAPPLQVLREHGVKVLTVREILAHGVEQHMGARVALERLALEALTYKVRPPLLLLTGRGGWVCRVSVHAVRAAVHGVHARANQEGTPS